MPVDELHEGGFPRTGLSADPEEWLLAHFGATPRIQVLEQLLGSISSSACDHALAQFYRSKNCQTVF
jgi:hypothetical protein